MPTSVKADDIATHEVGGMDPSNVPSDYNYDTWHIGNTADPSVGSGLFEFIDQGIKLFPSNSGPVTQLLKGNHINELKPDSVTTHVYNQEELIDFVQNDVAVHVASGKVHLQIAGQINGVWTTLRPAESHGNFGSGSDVTTAYSTMWVGTGPLASFDATHLETLLRTADMDSFRLFGVGVVATEEAVISDFMIDNHWYSFAIQPTLNIVEDQVNPGDEITITGEGYFGTGEGGIRIAIFDELITDLHEILDLNPLELLAVTELVDGAFSTRWTVPADFEPGFISVANLIAWDSVEVVIADDEDGDNDGSETGEEIPDAIDPSELTDDKQAGLDAPASAPIGSTITFSLGSEFADQTVHIWIHSTPAHLGAVTLNASGSGSVALPSTLTAGPHSLVAQDEAGELIAWASISLTSSDIADPTPGAVDTATGGQSGIVNGAVALSLLMALAAAVTLTRRKAQA